MLLIVYLLLYLFVWCLQLCTLPQNLVNTSLYLVHPLVHDPHILLFAIRLVQKFLQLWDFLLVRSLHLLDDSQEYIVPLNCLLLLLLDFTFIEKMQIFQPLMQLNCMLRFRKRSRILIFAELRIRLRMVELFLLFISLFFSDSLLWRNLPHDRFLNRFFLPIFNFICFIADDCSLLLRHYFNFIIFIIFLPNSFSSTFLILESNIPKKIV